MPKLTNKDGELRIYEGGSSNYYVQVLFTQGDFTAPMGRMLVEEMLNLDRGNLDANTSYFEGPDDTLLEGLPISFSAIVDSSANNRVIFELLSGTTLIATNNGSITDSPVTMVTTKASSAINAGGAAFTTPSFGDTAKIAYNVEILWDQSNADIGMKYNEVWFQPSEQSLNEGVDSVTLNMSGLWYGSSTTITAFTSGTSI